MPIKNRRKLVRGLRGSRWLLRIVFIAVPVFLTIAAALTYSMADISAEDMSSFNLNVSAGLLGGAITFVIIGVYEKFRFDFDAFVREDLVKNQILVLEELVDKQIETYKAVAKHQERLVEYLDARKPKLSMDILETQLGFTEHSIVLLKSTLPLLEQIETLVKSLNEQMILARNEGGIASVQELHSSLIYKRNLVQLKLQAEQERHLKLRDALSRFAASDVNSPS